MIEERFLIERNSGISWMVISYVDSENDGKQKLESLRKETPPIYGVEYRLVKEIREVFEI